MKRIAVIRIRGRTGIRKKFAETLALLRLHRINHLVIVNDEPSYTGMLKKCEHYITYGEINKETFKELLLKRGRLVGNKRLTEEYIKENTKFNGIDDFVEKYFNFEADLIDIPGLKPVFRLHPPRKGFKSIKKHVKNKGDLGYRGDDINQLIKRMM